MNELVNSLVSIKLSTNRLRKEVGVGVDHKLLTIEKLVDDIALRHDVLEEVKLELSWIKSGKLDQSSQSEAQQIGRDMFEVYSGTNNSKQSVESFDVRNDAIRLAWQQHAKTETHHGVMVDGKVIFNTDFDDAEFGAVQG